MAASLRNPEYTAVLIDGATKYDITPAITEIELNDQEKQIAQSASITMTNVKVGDTKLNAIVKARQRVFIYANDGEKKDEVFRGWVWTRYYGTDVDKLTITLKCYDNLIYLQESEDSLYFSAGQDTASVMRSICGKWGINLSYSYSAITHEQLVLRGTLSDIFTSDILDKVKERTGVKYVVGSQKDTMYVKPVGQNTTKYAIKEGENAVQVREEQTMDDMVTQVVILGKAEEGSEQKPVLATVKGNTSGYGTLQKLADQKTDSSLADAQKEAQNILKEKGSPFWSYEVRTADIPWIRKGDKINLRAGGVYRDLIVVSVERSITNKKKEMTLTCEKVQA